MEGIRVLHCADLHLGFGFAGLGRRAAGRRADLRNTFLEITALCAREDIRVLAVSGDLFDHVEVPAELLETVRDAFAAIPDTAVAVAPGNHDPLSADSPYLREDFWPENVHIFGTAPCPVVLPEHGVRLWGAAFSAPYVHRPLLEGLRAPDGDMVDIGILHGMLVSPGQASEYNPVTEAQIAASGFDYLALGHVHAFGGVHRAGGTSYAYSGCPEGRGFDETGTKGVLVGAVSKGRCEMEFRPLCRRRYGVEAVDVSGAGTVRKMGALVRAVLAERYGAAYVENLYKIVLEGAVPDGVRLDPEELLGELGDLFYVKLRDDTEVALDLEAAQRDFSLRGVFVRMMAERMAAGEDVAQALKLGLRAFSGKVEYRAD